MPVLDLSNHLTEGQVEDRSIPTFEEFSKDLTCSKSVLPPLSEGNGAVTDSVYANSTFGFKIQYPSDWQIEEQFCTAEHPELTQDFATVNIQSTAESKEQGSVTITVGFDPIVPLDDYVVFMTKQKVPGLELSDPESFSINGIQAYHIVITKDGISFGQTLMDVNGFRYTILSPISNIQANSASLRVISSFSVS